MALIAFKLWFMANGGLYAITIPSLWRWVPSQRIRLVAIHSVLLLSTIIAQMLMSHTGTVFPWQVMPWSIVFYLSSIAFAVKMLGTPGWIYTLSVIIQETNVQSAAFLIAPYAPIALVLLLVVSLYVIAHFMDPISHWKEKFCIIAAWGCCSVLLFSKTHDLFLVMAIHTLGGTVLLRYRFLCTAFFGIKD